MVINTKEVQSISILIFLLASYKQLLFKKTETSLGALCIEIVRQEKFSWPYENRILLVEK